MDKELDNYIPTANSIRARIRAELPAYVFDRTPKKAWLFLLLNALIASLIYFAVNNSLPWYGLLLVSLILGQAFTSVSLLAHEVMHGSILKSKKQQNILSFFGFYTVLVSPTIWRVWHVKAHHGNTNTKKDPDSSISLDQHKSIFITRLWIRLMPSGTQPITGFFFFFYWFTAHGQTMLWMGEHIKDWNLKSYRYSRVSAFVETFLMYGFWLTLAFSIGIELSIYLIVIPMMINNVILIMFISCQHLFLPRLNSDEDNNPLTNTTSMKVPSLIGLFNVNFQNHVEHHLFPSMSYVHTPVVRKWLRDNMSDYYMEPDISTSLRYLFSTPRVYIDNNHLVYPNDLNAEKVDTRKIRESLIKA